MRTISYFILLICNYKVTSSSSISLFDTPYSSNFITPMDTLAQLIDSCFANKSLVILRESNTIESNEFIKTIFSKNKYDITLINDSPQKHSVNLRTKSHVFIILVNSANNSSNILKDLKRSVYWDHMSLFVFVDDNFGNSNKLTNCNNAKDILKSAWHINIQSSLYICIDANNKLMIFTYNPFSNRAPASWIRIEDQSEKYWTLYSQKYHKDLPCNTLDYNRDEALDGYPIRLVRHTQPFDSDKIKADSDYPLLEYVSRNYDPIEAIELMLIRAISSTLNMTPFISLEQKNKAQYHYFGRLENNLSDLTFFVVNFHFYTNSSYSSSYPIYFTFMNILSHTQGFFSPLEKIWNFFGIITLISMSIVLTITFFVILKIKKHSVSFAGFEILRLIINASLQVRMNTISMRIYFAVVLIYFLIFQALFQGNLSKFLTKPSTKPNIDSIKDLNSPSIDNVYVGSGLTKIDEFVKEIEPFNDKVAYTQLRFCIDSVIENKRAVCVGPLPFLQERSTVKETLHIGKNFYPFRLSYLTRNDWPLHKRFDSSILKLHENGFVDYYKESVLSKSVINERKKKALLEVIPRAISLNDINFAFVILMLGLTLSFIVFLFELDSKNNLKNRKRKILKKRRRY